MKTETTKEAIASTDLPKINVKELIDEENRDRILTVEERLTLVNFIQAYESEPYKYYIPNGACHDYIKQIGIAPQSGKRIFLFSAANGVGKCLPLDTPILMANGHYKQLKDVRTGDYVLGHDYDDSGYATPTKVLGTSRAGVKKVYKITLKDKTIIFASGEHSFPMKLRSGRGSSIKKKRIEELLNRKTKSIGSKIMLQQPRRTIFKSKNKLPIDPYLLGVLLGDVGLSNRDSVKITNTDNNILRKVEDILFRDYSYILKQQKDKITFSITKNVRNNKSNILLDQLRKLKLSGTKAHNKFIPHIYKTASIQARKQLLCGLIDTDGFLKGYSTKSEKLCDDFVFIVKSLGGVAIKHEKYVNYKDQKIKYYNCYWAFDYKLPLLIPRKQIIPKKPIEYSNRFVEKIEYFNNAECGDIWVEHSKHTYLSHDFISTGNTTVIVNIMANIFYGTGSKWFDFPLFKNRWRLPHLMWFITEDSTLKETIEPEIVKWFPVGRYKLSAEGKTHIYRLTTDTNFTMFFKTIDQDADKFESATLGAIFYDEPPPEKIHQACVSRLRQGGMIFAELTPLHRAAWILDKWILKDDIQKYFYVRYADIWENSITKGVRGRLKDADIDFMISQYDPIELEARTKGKFTHLRGLVYKSFESKEPFVVDDFDVWDYTKYQIICVIDPHDRRYPAVGWYAVDRAKNYWIVAEWPNLDAFNGKYYHEIGDANYVFKDIVVKIKEFEAKMGWKNVNWRKIDPNRGKTPYGNSGFTVQEEFERHGMYFDDDVNDDKVVGHQMVRDLLVIGNFKKPRLQVFKSCKNHIWSFLRYSYDEYEGKYGDKRSPREDVLDIGKDFMDCVRYFAVGDHGYQQMKGEPEQGWRSRVLKKQQVVSFMGA
jgi:phage terminase large subunit-like protein